MKKASHLNHGATYPQFALGAQRETFNAWIGASQGTGIYATKRQAKKYSSSKCYIYLVE